MSERKLKVHFLTTTRGWEWSNIWWTMCDRAVEFEK